MDGRVQLPVINWILARYKIDFVDVITEAGMDGVLCKQSDISEILRSINVSIKINKSTRLFIVGHHDCRGNPVDIVTHHSQIQKSVDRLKSIFPDHEVIGLWVNNQWQVEIIASFEIPEERKST
jgi:hypothetical protein